MPVNKIALVTWGRLAIERRAVPSVHGVMGLGRAAAIQDAKRKAGSITRILKRSGHQFFANGTSWVG